MHGKRSLRPPPRDDFEYHARLWSADEKILAGAAVLEDRLNLDPILADRLEHAVREGEGFEEAAADFLEAVVAAFPKSREDGP